MPALTGYEGGKESWRSFEDLLSISRRASKHSSQNVTSSFIVRNSTIGDSEGKRACMIGNGSISCIFESHVVFQNLSLVWTHLRVLGNLVEERFKYVNIIV